jgi:hypothetical protein
MALPPEKTGAIHETFTDAFPLTALMPRGASGVVKGTTAEDAAEALLGPTAFVAITVKL